MEEQQNRSGDHPVHQQDTDSGTGVSNTGGSATYSSTAGNGAQLSYSPEPVKEKNGKATAGMWCGIAALVTLFIPLLQVFAPLVLGILAIVFGIIGKKQSGTGLSGIIMGSIALVLYVLFAVLFFVGLAIIGSDPTILEEF